MKTPPKPLKEDLEYFGWVLTGDCRKPDPNRHEYFCCIWDDLFMPWSSQTGKAINHELYGENRWIIEPKPTNPVKVHLEKEGDYELGLCGSYAPYTYRRTKCTNKVTCKRCLNMIAKSENKANPPKANQIKRLLIVDTPINEDLN